MARKTKGQLPEEIKKIMREAAAQRLAYDDDAFEEAAKRRGLDMNARSIPPPPRQQHELQATPYQWKDPNTLPRRQWIYDRSLVRKYVTVTVAPGGVGKSSLTTAEGLALVTGRPLLGKHVEGRMRVWIMNLEDPRDELELRIQAICEFYDISAEDIDGRFFVDSGREQPICTAITTRNRTTIQRPVVDQLSAELRRREIDVLIVDPFVSSHAASENDNSAMDMIAKEWSRIADSVGCAIHLVHHTRKLGSDADVTAESSRGGKALTDAARVVRAINRMSKEEGEKFGVENHREFFRAFNDKSNMAPPAEISDWYRIHNVMLPNGEHVGVVGTWTPPDAFADVNASDLLKVQLKIDGKDWREDMRSPLWVGIAVAEVLGLDSDDAHAKQRIKTLLKTWVANGALCIETIVDNKSRERRAVRVGRWVE